MQIARRLTTGFPVYLRIRYGRFFVNEVNTDLALMDQTDKTSIMPLKSSWSQREEKESPFVVLDLFHWKQKHPTGETRKVWQDLKRVFSFPSVLYTGNRLEIRKRLFRERVVGQLKLPPQGSGHSRDWDFQSSRITWTMLSDWLLGGPVWRQELDFIIIMDPFQSGIFYDANLYLKIKQTQNLLIQFISVIENMEQKLLHDSREKCLGFEATVGFRSLILFLNNTTAIL